MSLSRERPESGDSLCSKRSWSGMKIGKVWCRWLQVIESGLFPSICTHCRCFILLSADGNRPRLEPEMKLRSALAEQLAGLLCGTCIDGLQSIASPICSVCGAPFPTRSGKDHCCGACIERPKAFRKARSVGVHETALMSVIHAFKYNGRIRHGRCMGQAAFDTLTAFWSRDELDLVIPVPLHPARRRQRGFNQSHILVRQWPELAEARAPEWSDLSLSTGILIRHRRTRQQTGLKKEERRANIRGAFSLRRAAAIAGKRVLLVDDVFTTGATVEECSRVLLKAGAASVDVLTVARAL